MQHIRTVPILRSFDGGKAREFYVGFLGLNVDWEHRFEPETPLYMQVSRAGIVLHISEHHGDATPGSHTRPEMKGCTASTLSSRQGTIGTIARASGTPNGRTRDDRRRSLSEPDHFLRAGGVGCLAGTRRSNPAIARVAGLKEAGGRKRTRRGPVTTGRGGTE
jgi:hypothetical protein